MYGLITFVSQSTDEKPKEILVNRIWIAMWRTGDKPENMADFPSNE